MLFTWCMLAGFILLLAPQSITNKFQFAFTRIFRWPISLGNNFSLATSQQQPFTNELSRSDVQYRNQVAYLQQELKQAYQRIEKLSGIRNRFPLTKANMAPADIITKTLNDSKGELIIINRGQIDGLKANQFVMADLSIIGKISDVDSGTARVKLFTDPTSKIKVKIGKLEVYRIMQGAGNISAKVLNLQTTHDVKIGDNVFACKEPGLLDVPMIIGTVAQCKPDDKNPIVWDITVRPACDIAHINDVAVIIMNP